MKKAVAHSRQIIFPAAVLALVCAQLLCAGEPPLVPAGIFTDNMVLQRDVPVPVWGTAQPGEPIEVNFAGQTKTAVADKDGKWKIVLEPLKLSSASAEMIIKGKSSVTLKNILVGDVWLCSGQSNMFMPLEGQKFSLNPVLNSKEEVAQANFPMIRFYTEPLIDYTLSPSENFKEWRSCSPQTVAAFSATAYFFGKMVYQKKKVPIGLIHISRGGASIGPWTPKEEALAVPFMKKNYDICQANRDRLNTYNVAYVKFVTQWREWAKTQQGDAPKPPDIDPVILQSQRFGDSSLFDSLIQPVIPYAIRGVIWYQGESNADFLDGAQDYDNELQALVSGWRRAWGGVDFPFYYVQLPRWENREREHFWSENRLSMLRASKQIKNVWMAVTIDAEDTKDLHPNTKKLVGERLAQLALSKTYGEEGVCSGPMIHHLESKNASLAVCFEESASSLKCKGEKLTPFEIAGEDGVFVPAEAEIQGSEVMVRSASVKKPVAVRYGWGCFFEATLFNAEGFPASPFSAYIDKKGKTVFRSSPFSTDTRELENATTMLAQANSALVPVPQLEAWWTQRHEEKLAVVQRGGIDMLFIGDSITQLWETNGKAIWEEYYGNRNAVNLGYGGDRTEIVLWRFAHGEIDGIDPKLAVVMIGSNNWGNSPEEIAAGVDAVVKTLRKKLPKTKVLLLAILPRGDLKPELRERHVKANALIARAIHDDAVHFLNMNSLFLDADGMASKLLLPDGGHPNEKGYRVWAETIEPKVAELLGDAERRKH